MSNPRGNLPYLNGAGPGSAPMAGNYGAVGTQPDEEVVSEDSRGPRPLRRIAASVLSPGLSGWHGGCPAAAAIRKHFRQDSGGVLRSGRRSRRGAAWLTVG